MRCTDDLINGSSSNGNLVPRPSPKPSRIEVPALINGPEVPEASLLFDPNAPKIETPVGLGPLPRHSINPQKHLENSSTPSYSRVFDSGHQLYSKCEPSSCCCRSISEPSQLNRYNSHTPSVSRHLDFVRTTRPENLAYHDKNEMQGANHHHIANYNYEKPSQALITLEEYQKMISQFTEMILDRDQKFNQVLRDSISREELGQITKKFDLQIKDLTLLVNNLDSKLEKMNRQLESHFKTECKCSQKSCQLAYPRSTEPKHCRDDNRLMCDSENEYKNHNHQVLRQSQKQLPAMTSQFDGQDRDCECKNRRCKSKQDIHEDQVSRNVINLHGGADPVLQNTNSDRDSTNSPVGRGNDSQKPMQCYSRYECKQASQVSSDDRSLLMWYSLAKKYISESNFDNTKQDCTQELDMMICNTRNNVNRPTETPEYMERHHLVPSTDENSTDPLGVRKTKPSSSNQESNYQLPLKNSDQSFVR